MKTTLHVLFAAILGSVLTVGLVKVFDTSDRPAVQYVTTEATPASQLTRNLGTQGTMVDFVPAAEKALPAVVHITSASVVQRSQADVFGLPDPFRDFFNMPRGQQQVPQGREELRKGTGSGVIISSDGYIVTNNHVVDNADEVTVALNDNRSFVAEVVGTDPSTDIALLKIDASQLDYLNVANSDEVKVGEWVLAVGNPFNLASTVTAGIVSAKGRNINILRNRGAIESFIQTDAAVNPGNSGGALVDLQGNLIGINTAIASPTGAFAGYSFAVPSRIVTKVIEDLKNYGTVQRAYLGVMIRDVNNDLSDELNLRVTEGVLIDSLLPESAALEAGLETEDVIVGVEGNEIKSTAQLLEAIGRKRPGETAQVEVIRKGSNRTFDIVLKNRSGNTEVVRKSVNAITDVLGADFEAIEKNMAKKLGILGGVQITALRNGKLKTKTPIREGFVITHVNQQPVSTAADLEKVLTDVEGGVMIQGVYPDEPGTRYYAFGM